MSNQSPTAENGVDQLHRLEAECERLRGQLKAAEEVNAVLRAERDDYLCALQEWAREKFAGTPLPSPAEAGTAQDAGALIQELERLRT